MNDEIRNLLEEKRELELRIGSLPYHGTPEIKRSKDNKYLYMRKRELGKITSNYVGVYSDDLYNLLITNNRNERLWNKDLRTINKKLASLNYVEEFKLSSKVILNIDFARKEMKNSIYDQAVLEGVATTFANTSEIIDNGEVNGMKAEDVLKIVNLKHAWEFVMDELVLSSESDFYVMSTINKFINQGIYYSAGLVRNVPVRISGTTYIPTVVVESMVREEISSIIKHGKTHIEIAIDLALYVMKKQVFNDGNKRTGVIFANHYLISKGEGLLVIPYNLVKEFQERLVQYYEDEPKNGVVKFMKECCWQRFDTV